ncbi:MAG: sigma 54-interacting transcriptional regulator [Gammaproteobacteria bacterium]|nr:sigma 54-interacting transcriptional regulator [Gammaproteobacteria bacterium]
MLRERSFSVHLEPWNGHDPTDHREVFEFLRDKLPRIRRRFRGRELVLHISPGTPSMHTVWVLMAETGFVEPPFTVVKSYRRSERRGRSAVVPVELGIETFYKTYKASRPRQLGSEEQGVIWDPSRFRTEAMKRVYADARRVAPLNVPVLIRGERGTGKTTMANWIRSNSPYKREEQNANWPSVACGQYGSETMRAELFGYRKDAFTGATSDREGLLAAAHRDTLFLDEVGDVSRDLQRLLIRAVEEKRYFALGDDKPRESNFRLLTATNIDDVELRNRLDPDFLDRISLLTLDLPPLREVREELPWLWEAVYDEARRRAGVPKRNASIGASHHQRVVTHLRTHSLPGNLRDLFRVAYRVLAARNDIEEPMSSSDAVLYGVGALADSISRNSSQTTVARSAAGAFACGAPINDLFQDGRALNTAHVLADFKAFLASEIRRISSERGVKESELCDVSERSLREWVRAGTTPRQNSTDQRRNSSGNNNT